MKTALKPLFSCLVLLMMVAGVNGQTKGFIYQPCTNSTIRAVLDPNGDGYTSASSSGFSTGLDTSSYSELHTISLPVLFNEASGDVITGATGGHTDLVSNGSTHAVDVLVKTVSGIQYLIVRFRIGKASTASKGYSILIDSDSQFGTYLSSNNPGYDREVILETGNPGNVKIYQHTATTTTLQTYSADQYSQRSIAATTVDGDADYFYDFCVPLTQINANSFVRLTAATITSAQSGIGGTVSDFDGLPKYDNQFQAMKDIVNSFPSTVKLTDLVDGFFFPKCTTIPPVITSSLNTNSSSVSGTSTEASGTTITVYCNRSGTITTLGTTTVTASNTWTLSSGVSGNLSINDVIYATATASGRSESSSSNQITITRSCPYIPPPSITDPRPGGGGQNLSGTWAYSDGSFPSTATEVELVLYQQTADNTFSTVSATTQYVGTNGTFTFSTGMTNTNYNNASLVLVAKIGSCTSGYSNVSKKTNGQVGTITTTPTLNTSPILTSATSVNVTNNDASAATLYVYVNGVQVGASASTVNSGANSNVNISGSLYVGDVVVSRAQVTSGGTSYWISGPSNSVTVTSVSTQTNTPAISGSYTSSNTSVSGTCDEAAGTIIKVYKAGSTLLGTTTVNAFGAWTLSGLTLAGGDVLTATALASGKTLSPTSTSVTVASATPTAPTITTSPIYANFTTSITGSGALAGGTVYLYIDGEQIGSVATAGAGSWTINSIPASAFYKGGSVTAKNYSSNNYSAASTGVTVTGISSFTITAQGGGSIGQQTAGVAFNIALTAKDAVNATFTNYTGTNSVGGSVPIVSGYGPTSAFTTGALSSHTIQINKAATGVTLNTLATSDPTVSGTYTSFNVVANVANKLQVNRQATVNNNTNTNFITQPEVYVTDAYDNWRSADATGSITASIASGTTGAVLSGTKTLNVSGGKVTYTDLQIDRPGQYVLQFVSSSGLTTVYSDTIYVGRVWMGRNSTDFNTSSNWSNTTIPSANDDIAFAQTPSSDLYLDADRTITNYYNYSTNSKKLIVNGKKLTIKGAINHSAASINAAGTAASPSEVEFAGSSAQTIAANTFVGDSAYKININNSNGVALTGTLKINGVLAPTAGVLTTNNNLTLRSYSVTNTAVVSQGSSSGGYVSGNVTVERYFPPRRAFRLVTSPVTTTTSINANWQEGAVNSTYVYSSNNNPVPGYGTHITGPQGSANGLDVTQSMNSSMYTWNNGTQTWSAVTNTFTNTLTAGTAYRLMIRGDRSIDYNTNTPTPTYTILRSTGTLPQGDQNTLSLNGTADAWNIVANPFQSQVDMGAVTKTNLKNFYYVWDPQRGTRGAWVTYNFSTGSSDLGSAVNQYVQPGQSMFVQTTSTATTSIKFNEAHKNNNTTFTAVHRSKSTFPKLYVSLNYSDSLASGARSADGFAVVFSPTFSNSDSDDVPKLANLDENFGIEHLGKQYTMELHQMPVVNDSFPIYINQYTDFHYTIRAEWETPITGSLQPYLIDKYTNTEYAINNTGYTDVAYTIDNSIPATKDARRFVIVFKNVNALPLTGIEVSAVKQNSDIKVQWTALNEQNMSLYEVEKSTDGKTFTKVAMVKATGNNKPSASYSWTDANIVTLTQYYRIKAVSLNGREQYSAIVKVSMSKEEVVAVNITPNPVTDSRVQVQVSNMPAAVYELNVFDAMGRKVAAKTVQHQGGNSQYSIDLPVNKTSGIYYLRISSEAYSNAIPFKVQ